MHLVDTPSKVYVHYFEKSKYGFSSVEEGVLEFMSQTSLNLM